MTEESSKNPNINPLESLLTEEFFTTINTSKKINDKKTKIDSLDTLIKNNPTCITFFQNPCNKEKYSTLLSLLNTHLNENNNNYVIALISLITTLTEYISSEENFNNFIKQSLSKLFDKFYLQNPKINDMLIRSEEHNV